MTAAQNDESPGRMLTRDTLSALRALPGILDGCSGMLAQAMADAQIWTVAETLSRNPIRLGAAAIDERLGGGLMRGGLHEIFAGWPPLPLPRRQPDAWPPATTPPHGLPHAGLPHAGLPHAGQTHVGQTKSGPPHIGAAAGFAVLLALRAAGGKPIVWARQECLDTQTGRLNAAGLKELGLDPSRIILVRARNPESTLRAGEEAARCGALGAVLIEPWGEPRILDLTATRRLSLAAAASGVPVLMQRGAASPVPSAAATRWLVGALPSRPLAADAPGFPAFALSLLRRRGGEAGFSWSVEWDRDRGCFTERHDKPRAPLSRPVVAVSGDRPAAAAAPHEHECALARAAELARAG